MGKTARARLRPVQCLRVRRKLNTYSIRLVDGGSAEGRSSLGGGMERAGLGRSGGANSRQFAGKTAKTVSFCFILFHSLAGSAGCVQHIETLARRNWSGKLQSVTEMRQVGGGCQMPLLQLLQPHPFGKLRAGSNLHPSKGKGLVGGGAGPSSRGRIARVCVGIKGEGTLEWVCHPKLTSC